MRRIIVTGKNNELPREAISRAVWAPCNPGVSSLPGGNCQTAFYSGITPDSVAGGPRRAPASRARGRHAAATDLERLGVLAEAGMWFLIAMLVASILVVGAI